jgi:ribosome maturation factor RimP
LAKGTLNQIVETTVTGLGYDLADCEIVSRGRLIRVFIDRLDGEGPIDAGVVRIKVEDCERVTRQLQRVLEVEGIDYDRLEVSSPGLDRVLKTVAHFRRFAGQEIELRLRIAVGGRRRFTGVLEGADDRELGMLVDGEMCRFALGDIEKVRLVPRW